MANGKGGQKRKKKSSTKRETSPRSPSHKTKNSINNNGMRLAAWPSVAALMAMMAAVFIQRPGKSDPSGPSVGEGESTCNLVMAPSSLPGENVGWGVFSLKGMKRDVQAASGDIVIHVPDIPAKVAEGMDLLIKNYMWLGEVASGQFEGRAVISQLPSLGMLANGHASQFNVVPHSVTAMDNGLLHRASSPGAGAISNHYNHTFFAFKDIPAGGEILNNYGSSWLSKIDDVPVTAQRDVSWLQENGLCLDNIEPKLSTINNAGRGAFATRSIKNGTVIAPVPVIPLTRTSLKMVRKEKSETTGEMELVDKGDQLMLNYCYGHSNSSMLLFSYAPMVNYINHDSMNLNAKLRWSTSSMHRGQEWLEWPLDKVKAMKHSGLMLEYVATRDIEPGEEILVDYGKDWQNAWDHHVQNWKERPKDFDYFYPKEMEQASQHLLTYSERKEMQDYPENIMTVCYYMHRKHHPEPDGTTRWQAVSGTFRPPNLRPCTVLSRNDDNHSGGGQGVRYTVAMHNYIGSMHPEEIVPENENSVVTNVPRRAIKFVDKVYSSDQHLKNAFRHEISLPDDLFPKQWMDLS